MLNDYTHGLQHQQTAHPPWTNSIVQHAQHVLFTPVFAAFVRQHPCFFPRYSYYDQVVSLRLFPLARVVTWTMRLRQQVLKTSAPDSRIVIAGAPLSLFPHPADASLSGNRLAIAIICKILSVPWFPSDASPELRLMRIEQAADLKHLQCSSGYVMPAKFVKCSDIPR